MADGSAAGGVVRTAGRMVETVRNIYCIGRNYRDHALELGNEVPEAPIVFGKFTHALAPAEGLWVMPQGREVVHHELEVVLWFKRAWAPGLALQDVVGGVALGIDWTDRAAQNRLKAKGQPWEFAKAFRASALITDVHEVVDWDELWETPFSLDIDGRRVQTGRLADVLFPVPDLVQYVGEHFGLGPDDLLYTGTPEGVGPVQAGSQLTLRWADEVWGQVTVGKAD